MIGYNANAARDRDPRGALPSNTCKEYPMDIKHSIACRRLIQGIGINDADYVVNPIVNGNRIPCPFYRCWQGMLHRCYSAATQSRQPTYIGCKVCDEWKYFMAFKSWMETQDWKDKELDKDLLGNGKLYSPDNCVFISQALNKLFTDSGASRGEHPIGVYWEKIDKKYSARVAIDGKRKRLGLFANPDDAHAAWYKAKLEIANGYLASESNPRIRYAIECGIAKLQCKYGSGNNARN